MFTANLPGQNGQRISASPAMTGLLPMGLTQNFGTTGMLNDHAAFISESLETGGAAAEASPCEQI